jgi:ubiquinone/menaquinone biosynthesis C-methylase UbiE
MSESHNIFTGKSDFYARYRPGYPVDLTKYLSSSLGFKPGCTVADIGSGTGIMSKYILDLGCRVFCVEPNDDMRRMSEKYLEGYSECTIVNGKDEDTTLPANSMDSIIVAQAFHWFDLEKFRSECSGSSVFPPAD